ncbi:MAG: FAD-dependent oxidoreductase [Sedimentisphaeraceae bacterium JB056]
MYIREKYDVIVVGGGISGAMAAVAAAKEGVSVLVIEQHGFLGGMLTAAGVGPMMSFYAGDMQIIKGLTSELVDKLVEEGKSPGHIYDTNEYTYTVTPFDTEAMKYQLDEMFTESGVAVLFHTMLAGVNVEDNAIESIEVCNKGGVSKLKAGVFIDASGDADLAAWAGVNCSMGRKGDGRCQPVTMNMRMVNVDIDAIKSYIRRNPGDFPFLRDNAQNIDKGSRLSIGGFRSIVKMAKDKGDFDIDSEVVLIFEANNKGEVIVNTSRIYGYNPVVPTDLSEIEVCGRQQVRNIDRFLRKWVPGFENSTLAFSGPTIGVRSSRQIKGLYILNAKDILSFRKHEDSIAFSGYPINFHPVDRLDSEMNISTFRGGDYYGIPYRTLVNPQISNLITVGRCISSTFEAQAAIRTSPTMGAVGHAGGAAAAIASRRGMPVYDVPLKGLKAVLRQQGAFLGE